MPSANSYAFLASGSLLLLLEALSEKLLGVGVERINGDRFAQLRLGFGIALHRDKRGSEIVTGLGIVGPDLPLRSTA